LGIHALVGFGIFPRAFRDQCLCRVKGREVDIAAGVFAYSGLMAAIETHQAMLGCTPRLVAADAGFYSAKNEAAAKAKGVKRVCVPNRSTKSPERKREQKKR